MTASPVAPSGTDRRRGQTLAEFAISLPLLLLLLFGVLEFGRMFQSWVTLQNAARTAARYAITGQYNTDKYDLDFIVPCRVIDSNFNMTTYNAPIFTPEGSSPQTNSIQIFARAVTPPPSGQVDVFSTNDPHLLSDPLNDDKPRRAAQEYRKANGDLIIKKWDPFSSKAITDLETLNGDGSNVNVVPINDDESLYATWYGYDGAGVGADCYPSDETFQRRKDMARLASIYDEARRGASGLLLDASLTGNGTREEFEAFLYNFWSNPAPHQDDRAWFNMMMCSSRQRLYNNSITEITNNPDDRLSMESDPAKRADASLRFHTYLGPGFAPNGPSEELLGGGCLLKESPQLAYQGEYTTNYNASWADAGDSGDRITIVITYNHPLITPIGLARYIRMAARRSAVNESFKVTSAERALGPSGVTGPGYVSPTPLPPSDTPVPSNTPPFTPTYTATPSITPTPTASPFTCSEITAGDVFFDLDGRSVVAQINNGSFYHNVVLTRTVVYWNTTTILATSPDAYFGYSSLDSNVHWIGNAPNGSNPAANVSPIDSTDATHGTFYGTADTIENRLIQSGERKTWKGTFLNLTGKLSDAQYGGDFLGTRFYVTEYKSDGTFGIECPIDLEVPPMPPLPTAPPPNFTPSPTHTPDCADNRLKVEFVRFDTLGDVRLRVTNSRNVPGWLIGFTIYWPTRISSLRLAKVVVGGTSANDIPDPVLNPSGTGKVVWQNPTGASTSPTQSHNTSQGTWLADHVFPPNSITEVHLDFTGTGPATLSALGVHQSEFNGSILRILCTPPTSTTNRPGGPCTGSCTGGTGSAQGDIGFDAVPPPAPTNPPPATNTVGPTLTPSKTPTPAPPTATWTKGPPTKTFTPSPTMGASATFTPTATFTPIDMGGIDG